MRKASSSWLGQVVMATVVGFLIIAFGIWGIADVFRGSGRQTVATVGGVEISADQFRQAYNDQLQQLQRQIGRPIPPEQARAFGLDRQVLQKLMTDAALNERARQLGLGVGDDEIVKHILQDPSFRGINGQFDQTRFEQTLRAYGFTEPRYVAKLRGDAVRGQLADSFISGVTVPKTALEAFNRYQNEERNVDYVVLGPAVAGDIPEPSTEVLTKYFEDRKALFRAPEYRKVVLLALSPETIAKGIEVSDAEVKRAYDDHLSRYTTPERRDLQQIVFPNQEEADKAAQRLKEGTTFDALVKERGLKDTDVNLGLVTKTGIIDPAIADAAFALPADGTSDPIKGRFGITLVHVNKIEPQQVKPFADVEAELKREIALDRAKATITDTTNKVEDELASGARLDEVATKLNLPYRTIDAIDRSGRDPAGTAVADLPDSPDLLSNLFAAAVGAQNDALQLKGGGYVWYEVAGITPGRDRTFEEVKDKVEARWRQGEIESKLRAKADEMVKQINGGTKLADLAATDKLQVQWANNLKRQGSPTLPAQAVAAVFETPQGSAGTAEGRDASERIVFQVTNINVPAFDPNAPEAKKIEDTLKRMLGDETLMQYLQKTAADMGTTVNQDVINQALGAGNQ
ncbi:MAG: SurA N-terminal domain-containing protein [Xanthobacteraceae bacterium]|nr:SurA N-terminal domain-containing protein [Xanthobacteraceae bacterium]MBV9632129.1 SurA N-terminal domain-containing protein [Xanthobacteraceae bacterium]